MRKKHDVGNERCCIRKKKITDSEESLSLILLGVGKCDLEPNAISRKYFNAWKLVASEMRFPVSFLIYPLAFAQILSSYPQGPRVGYWCLSLSFCSTFVVERFYRHIKSKGRGTPGAGRALPEDFRTLCVYVCVCVCVCVRARALSFLAEVGLRNLSRGSRGRKFIFSPRPTIQLRGNSGLLVLSAF